jgi:hypothetical protein
LHHLVLHLAQVAESGCCVAEPGKKRLGCW